MDNDAFEKALERCEQTTRQDEMNAKARLTKAKARAELVRCFHDKWNVIFADEPTDSKDFDNWLDQYNDRIEQFLDVVNKSSLGEFLPAIQLTNDAQFICVSLLNQLPQDRRGSLKRLLAGPLTTWQQPFQNTLLVDRLLGWAIWSDALTWDERYQLYKTNCLETQNLGYDELHKENAFRHCRKQAELLKTDPQCPQNNELIRLDYHEVKSLNGNTIETKISNEQKTFLIEECKNAILVHWFLNRLPQSVKIWHDAGCPLKNVPPTNDPKFEQLVQELEFHSGCIRKKAKPKKIGRNGKSNKCLFIAALTAHHKYDNGSVLNYEPISTKGTGLSKAAASRQFKENFGSHHLYVMACQNGKLNSFLKKLNGDFGPSLLSENAQI
ncbi:hypothetical protein OAU26_07665 [Mariniblastus sp.]|nr:hypothetical protein [Mariniblastus sp.]